MGTTRRWWRRRRRTTAALATVTVIGLVGCSDDSPEPDAEADPAEASSSDLESPSDFECALPPDTVTDITGLNFTGTEPDGGALGGGAGSLTWQGCLYETDGDAAVEIAIVVDAVGRPDVAAYDRFAETAVDADADGEDVIGQGSFFDTSGGLYVRAPQGTLHLSVINSEGGAPPPADLETIATALLDVPDPKDCAALPAHVPREYDASSRTRSGTSREGTDRFVTCRFAVEIERSRGGRDLLEVGFNDDPESFERLRAEDNEAVGGEPVKVDGVGDSAVSHRGALYFRSGETAYVVSGVDDEDHPLEIGILEEIAAAVIDAA